MRFLLAGSLNTFVGLSLFYLALAIFPTPIVALVASTIASVSFNYFTVATYVFGSSDLRRVAGFAVVSGLVFIHNAVGLWLLAQLAVGPRIAGLLLLPSAVVASYTLNSRFVFGRSL